MHVAHASCGPRTPRMRSLCGISSSIFVFNGHKARRIDIPSRVLHHMRMLTHICSYSKRYFAIRPCRPAQGRKQPPERHGCAGSCNIREVVRTHAYTAFTWYPRMSGHDVHNNTHSKVTHPYSCTAGTARAKTKTDRHEGLSRARQGVDCARAGTSPEKQGCKRTITHNPQRRTIPSIPHACPDAYSEGCTATLRERVWLQRGKTRSLERMPAHPDMTRHDDHT